MSNRVKGISAILISALGFSLMNLFVPLAGEINSIQKSFFRNVIAMLIAWAIFFFGNKPQNYQSSSLYQVPVKQWLLLIFRSMLGTAGIWFNFYAVDKLFIADASVLNKIAPFCTLIFSAIFLNERLNKHHFYAIFMSFLGVLLVVKPGMNQGHLFDYFVGILGGICAGGAYTTLRRLNQNNYFSPAFLIAFFSTFSTFVSLPYILLNFQSMSATTIFILVIVGCMAAIGQFGVTLAYKFAPAREISVYDYSAIVFTGIWGFLFLNQIPDVLSMLGYLTIILSGYYNWYRNR